MKKIIYLCLMAIISSCSKAPINGDLDGLWQLTTIDNLDASGQTTGHVYQKDVFWAFQLHLVELGDNVYIGRFTNTGDSLRIYSLTRPSAQDSEEANDTWLTDEDLPKIAKYGLYALDTKFKIEQLDGDAMRLKSKDARLTFRKY